MSLFTLVALAVFHLAAPPGSAPYRAPQVAASSNLVALAYGSDKSIYVATSTDRGESFSPAIKVAEVGVLPLSRHRGPRIAFSQNALVVSAVTGSVEATGPHAHGLPSDGDLFAWRSTDGGKSWSKGVRINDVPAAAREGLHTLASDGRGNLFAAWLDLRNDKTRLYGASSEDGGVTWSPNVLVYESPDGTICQCCHPTASYAADGTLELMWRNCLDGARDFYLVRSKDGRKFGSPEKLGTGTWKINACPMDGGGLTHDGARTITAWRRESDIFLAEPRTPETKIGEGKDVTIAAGDGRVYAAWIENGELKLWANGKTDTLAQSAALPSIISLPGGGELVVWEENQGISVRRVP